ncbi:MAG TPA: type II toxin-antitoxin system prevent-host-death family antitoxin [Phycisphaerae bacterium]|nr:type II toxin-antitoxin system prevent-host-death family antitoxin [Phycisphaerae bacterium]
MSRWRLKDAQKKLPELLEKADREGPQTITAAPGRSYTLLPNARTSRKTKSKTPSLVETFLNMPKVPGFKIPKRDPKDTGRELPTFE